MDTQVSEELKPCPFCGVNLEDWGGDAMHHEFGDCPLSDYIFEDGELAGWNTRAMPRTTSGDGELKRMREEIAELGDLAKWCAKREQQFSRERNELLVDLKRVKILLCHAASRDGGMSQQFERKKAKEAVEVIDAALSRVKP